MTDLLAHGAARQNTSRGAHTKSAWLEEPEVGQDGSSPDEPPFRTWTREEVEALRSQQPLLSPWRVVAAQAAAGAVCFLIALVCFPRISVAWSVLYGAAVAVIPAALLARGLTRHSRPLPGAALIGFMFWEFVKIGVAVAMLLVAQRVVPDLSWPALLVAMIVCMKLSWLALLQRRKAPLNVAMPTTLKT